MLSKPNMLEAEKITATNESDMRVHNTTVVFSFLGLVIVGGSSFFLVFERIAMARRSPCQTTNAKKPAGPPETGPASYEALISGIFPNAFSRSRGGNPWPQQQATPAHPATLQILNEVAIRR
ncbi:MAG: hypothetical protein IH626_22875 [Rhodospirillales bacterium]|nr:hypothetical protein [Rhodospirillales bacterium]